MPAKVQARACSVEHAPVPQGTNFFGQGSNNLHVGLKANLLFFTIIIVIFEVLNKENFWVFSW